MLQECVDFGYEFSYFSAVKYLLFICLLFGLVTACTKDTKDEVPPVLEALSVDVSKVKPGDVINVDVSVSDNSALNQVRVRISPAFAKTFTAWEPLRVRDISGTFYQGVFSFTVPDSALAGYYQIATQGADMDGNGTIDSLVYITILQPGNAPQLVNFQTNPPMFLNTLFLTDGDTLSFSGLAVDDIEMAKVNIVLQAEDQSTLKSLQYTISDSTTTWSFTKSAGTIPINFEDKIPDQLVIKLLDSDGNQTRSVFSVAYNP